MIKKINLEPSEADITNQFTDFGFTYDIFKNGFRGKCMEKSFIAVKLPKFKLIIFDNDGRIFAISYYDFINLDEDHFNEFLDSLGEVRMFESYESGITNGD